MRILLVALAVPFLTGYVQAPEELEVPESSPECTTLTMDDPAIEARRALKIKDYRVFTSRGMSSVSSPGLTCKDPDRLDDPVFSRGGTISSDIPDVCGNLYSFYNLPLDKQIAFNRTMGLDSGFVAATGCRAKTRCEMTGEWAVNAANYRYIPHPRDRGTIPDCLGTPERLYALVINRDLENTKSELRKTSKTRSKRNKENSSQIEKALILAAAGGDVQMLKLLMSHIRIPAQLTNEEPLNILEDAILTTATKLGGDFTQERLEVVNFLMKLGARTEYRKGEIKISLLSELLKTTSPKAKERIRLAEILLRWGANPNGSRCPYPEQAGIPGARHFVTDEPPLRWAGDDKELVALLVEAGATPNGHGC